MAQFELGIKKFADDDVPSTWEDDGGAPEGGRRSVRVQSLRVRTARLARTGR